MDGNLIQSNASFSIRLEGDNEIDATILSNTIHDVAELTKLAAKAEDPEAYLKMNVTAFRNGSFQIDFSAICQLAESLINNSTSLAVLALTVVGTVKGFLEIKKLLKGEKPKKIEPTQDGKIEVENNNGQKIKVNKGSIAVFQNLHIDQLTINIANYSKEHNPNGSLVFSTPEGETICSAEDIKEISKPMPISEETTCKHSKIKTDLPIKKPAFIGHSSWDFMYNGHTITARIEDEYWIEEVNSGKIAIKAGDYIQATLEIYVEMDASEQEIPESARYIISKVHGGIHHDYNEQTKL